MTFVLLDLNLTDGAQLLVRLVRNTKLVGVKNDNDRDDRLQENSYGRFQIVDLGLLENLRTEHGRTRLYHKSIVPKWLLHFEP